ncbi:MAG: TolC family protein [Sulfurovaceae bacterium]
MRILFLFVLITFAGYAQSLHLGDLIASTKANNYEIKAKELEAKSKQSLVQSQRSDYYPSIDMGGQYAIQNKVTAYGAGEARSGFITARVIMNIRHLYLRVATLKTIRYLNLHKITMHFLNKNLFCKRL